MMVLNNAYNILESKHTRIFGLIKKGEDGIIAEDENKAQDIEDLHNIHNLNDRISASIIYLNNADKDTSDIIEAIEDYNRETDVFKSVKEEYHIIYKVMGYVNYEKYR